MNIIRFLSLIHPSLPVDCRRWGCMANFRHHFLSFAHSITCGTSLLRWHCLFNIHLFLCLPWLRVPNTNVASGFGGYWAIRSIGAYELVVRRHVLIAVHTLTIQILNRLTLMPLYSIWIWRNLISILNIIKIQRIGKFKTKNSWLFMM